MSLMAADVTSLIRLLSDYKNNNSSSNTAANESDSNNTRELVTRDFLGSAAVGSKELDLELKVPSGFHRRLDLRSGETYLEKSGSNPVSRGLQDLNLPPPAANDTSALDLKLLLPSSAAAPRSFDYGSVCTLDKVRSALERAGRESGSSWRNQGSCGSPSSSTSGKRRSDDQEVEKGKGIRESDGGSGLVAAGCPNCLMYVLISRGNPRCPRCDSHVPVTVPDAAKKQRIDLNSL